MKYFFWIAFAVFLAASIPHVAYFFASFEPTQGPEGAWWWAVSYAIAVSIDVTVYLLSWTAFQRYRKYRTPKAVWQHWLLIVMCTVFSWAVNWAYAKQFHSVTMLSSAESAAPWLINVFPFMASAFPLLGIVYTMMAETITETTTEKSSSGSEQIHALSELAKQTQLPMASLRRALSSGGLSNAGSLITTLTNRTPAESTREVRTDPHKAITGQFVAVEDDTAASEKASPTLAAVPSSDANPDKLQMTIEVLKAHPDMSDEALAEHLALKRPASARFWRLKAIEILNASSDTREPTDPQLSVRRSWATTGALANGTALKR